MNSSIRKVAATLAVLMVALFVNLNFVQVIKGNAYRDDPQNRRVLLNEYASPRGDINVGGTAIADSKETDDTLKYLRVYPQGSLYAPVTGFYSLSATPSTYLGTTGIETAENSVLSGDDPKLFGTRLTDLLTGRNPRGGSVELTLDRQTQIAAYQNLAQGNGTAQRRGAVVALDPTTGKILAAVSTPSYDPSLLSKHDTGSINHAYACLSDLTFPDRGPGEPVRTFQARVRESIRIQLLLRQGGTTLFRARHSGQPSEFPLVGTVYAPDASGALVRVRESYASTQFGSLGAKGCGDLGSDDPTAMFVADHHAAGPLHNRAFNELYPPGSTFKVVVTAAALKAGVKPTDQLIAPNGYYPETGRTANSCPTGSVNCIENFDGETCQNGKTATLAYSLAKSCNTTFAALAVEKLGGQQIAQQARQFGFDPTSSLEIPLPVQDSTVGTPTDLTAKGFLARTAFGQQDVRMTVLQGAMMAGAVANDGILMNPYLVDRELAPNLDEIMSTDPSQRDQVIDPNLDHDLQSMMEGVVTSPEGTGASAAIDNVVVGGKTGTADTGRKLANGQDEAPDAWFIGYAMVDGAPKIAVAVLIENGGVQGNETTGGEAAAPVAKAVIEAYLKGHGGP